MSHFGTEAKNRPLCGRNVSDITAHSFLTATKQAMITLLLQPEYFRAVPAKTNLGCRDRIRLFHLAAGIIPSRAA